MTRCALCTNMRSRSSPSGNHPTDSCETCCIYLQIMAPRACLALAKSYSGQGRGGSRTINQDSSDSPDAAASASSKCKSMAGMPKPEGPLPECPRCTSDNVKFCYYNNCTHLLTCHLQNNRCIVHMRYLVQGLHGPAQGAHLGSGPTERYRCAACSTALFHACFAGQCHVDAATLLHAWCTQSTLNAAQCTAVTARATVASWLAA